MDLKYKNVKKLDFKKWLLGGNSLIYGIILIVTFAAIFVALASLLMSEDHITDADNDEVTINTTTEIESSTPQYIMPHNIYRIRVNKASNFMTVYTLDNSGQYTVIHKQFMCSVNADVKEEETKISDKYIWVRFDYGTHGHYNSKLANGAYIHSVPYHIQDIYNIKSSAYYKLGKSADEGYIYLCAEDVKWIYDNCSAGTVVEVYSDSSELSPLADVKLAPIVNCYDPTDQEARDGYTGK